MKKIAVASMCIGMMFTMSACGSESNEDIANEVASKIEKAGWEIEHDPDAGTVVDELKLIINEDTDTYLSLTLSKESEKVEYITYNTSDVDMYDKESLGYNVESEKDDSYIASGYDLCMYNPEKEEVDKTLSFSSSCKSDGQKNTKILQEARDDALDKAKISLSDLQAWSEWYHETND